MILSAPKAKGTKLLELLLKVCSPLPRCDTSQKSGTLIKKVTSSIRGTQGKKSAVFAQIASTSLTPPSNISAFSCWAIACADTISASRLRRGVWSPRFEVSISWYQGAAVIGEFLHDGVYVSSAVITLGSAISYGPLSSISTAARSKTSLFSVTRDATAFMISPLIGCS
jgi:hypothetical protein